MAKMENTKASSDLLRLIYNVFLPPQLPQADDSDHGHYGILIEAVHECLCCFHKMFPYKDSDQIALALHMISSMQKIHKDGGYAIEANLKNELSTFRQTGIEPWIWSAWLR